MDIQTAKDLVGLALGISLALAFIVFTVVGVVEIVRRRD